MNSDTIPIGCEVKERVDGKNVIVKELVTHEDGSPKTAGEIVVTYDHDLSEITVADKNNEFGDESSQVISAYYVETLDRVFDDWRDLSYEELFQKAEEKNLKSYHFPIERLTDRLDGGYTGF